MKKREFALEVRVRTAVALICLMCAAAVGAYRYAFPSARGQAPQVSGVEAQHLIKRGCILRQTLHYAVCDHSVTRRLDAPETVLGMNRELFERAMADWRITAFSAQQIEMTRVMAMPCPAHWVICADENGLLGVYRNLYGEQMHCLRRLDIGVSAAPQSDQAQLRRGLCFDSAQEADAYIESIQS